MSPKVFHHFHNALYQFSFHFFSLCDFCRHCCEVHQSTGQKDGTPLHCRDTFNICSGNVFSVTAEMNRKIFNSNCTKAVKCLLKWEKKMSLHEESLQEAERGNLSSGSLSHSCRPILDQRHNEGTSVRCCSLSSGRVIDHNSILQINHNFLICAICFTLHMSFLNNYEGCSQIPVSLVLKEHHRQEGHY